MFGSDLENGFEALGDEDEEAKETHSDRTKEDEIHWAMGPAQEETHKRKIPDEEEEAAWKRSYKARFQEGDEKQDNYYAWCLSGSELRRR